ncbi:MAG TPA: hypothetical protein VIS72_01550 [Anaerolineales bacterium]
MIRLNTFLKLTPTYRDYVWGGKKLRPGLYPTAEAWVVWEDDVIESGSLAGKTLGEELAHKVYGNAKMQNTLKVSDLLERVLIETG